MTDANRTVRAHGLSAAISTLALAAGCGGAGLYGHAPTYTPIDEEASVIASAREYDAAGAHPQGEGSRKPVALFGVVESRAPGPGGQALLKLRVRELEPSNVCERPADSDSCRVTVSDKDKGALWALVSLRGDDDVGPLAVGQRSLVRIVGPIGEDVSPTDGAPVVHASWYRHFPPTQYLSKRASAMQAR